MQWPTPRVGDSMSWWILSPDLKPPETMVHVWGFTWIYWDHLWHKFHMNGGRDYMSTFMYFPLKKPPMTSSNANSSQSKCRLHTEAMVPLDPIESQIAPDEFPEGLGVVVIASFHASVSAWDPGEPGEPGEPGVPGSEWRAWSWIPLKTWHMPSSGQPGVVLFVVTARAVWPVLTPPRTPSARAGTPSPLWSSPASCPKATWLKRLA